MRCHAETPGSAFFSCSVCSLLSPLAPATFVERTKTWIQNPDFSSLAWSQNRLPLHLPHWWRSIPFSLRFQYLDTKSDSPIRSSFKNLDTKSGLSLSFLFFVPHFLRVICVYHLCRCSMNLFVRGTCVIICIHVSVDPLMV